MVDENEVYEGFRSLTQVANQWAEECRVMASDGLTVSELATIIVTGLRHTIRAADAIPVDGEERKKWVLHYSGQLFDMFADLCIPVYAKPLWFFVRPSARTLAQSLASGAIESLLPIIRGTV